MSICPKCGASVSMYDTGGNPWYACGSTKTFRSGSCVDREPVWTQLLESQQRIKRMEEMYEGVIGEKPELLGSNVMGLLKRELNFAQNRIKRLEEENNELLSEEARLLNTNGELERRIKRLEEALEGTVKWIVHLADSGDAGFWDVEKQSEIIAARAALKKESKP